jgi:hypothetical protein
MNDYSHIIYVLGALVLFGTFALRANHGMVRNDAMAYQNAVQSEALDLGETVIRQSMFLPFDLNTIDQPLANNDPTNLRLPSEFGLPTGLTHPRVFDDYHNFTWTLGGVYGEFHISSIVTYADDARPSQPVAVRTLRKMLIVTIEHESLETPLTLRYLRSYH